MSTDMGDSPWKRRSLYLFLLEGLELPDEGRYRAGVGFPLHDGLVARDQAAHGAVVVQQLPEEAVGVVLIGEAVAAELEAGGAPNVVGGGEAGILAYRGLGVGQRPAGGA